MGIEDWGLELGPIPNYLIYDNKKYSKNITFFYNKLINKYK